MKNIHVIPTDKLTKISVFTALDKSQKMVFNKDIHDTMSFSINQNIYITSDEEIKKGDWYYDTTVSVVFKNDKFFLNGVGYEKIILTTNQDLIKNDVQAIDDEFLEWFVKHPECEEVKINYDKDVFPYGVDKAKGYGWYKIIIQTEEPKSHNMEKKTIEEAAEDYADYNWQMKKAIQDAVKFGAEWYAKNQSEQMYSEEDLKDAWEDGRKFEHDHNGGEGGEFTGAESFEEWFNQYKKS